MAKAKLKNYYKPTPVKIRKIGDAMLGASTFGATTYLFFFEGNKHVAGAMFVLGVVGKFISNLFKDENNPQGADGCDAEPGAQ